MRNINFLMEIRYMERRLPQSIIDILRASIKKENNEKL
tara:strand:- start:5635 stop:5748 length:114 start_codon:yes stop_codon:yes gene_type:complete